MKSECILFKAAWISLVLIGTAILIYGLIGALWPVSSNSLFYRAIGVASVGMGLFGVMIAAIPYRRCEPWAWFTLWYYPVFWSAHLLGRLPPGEDHFHQIAFIVLSLAALVLSVRAFFPRGIGKHQ